MCAYSAILDYGRKNVFPGFEQPLRPSLPNPFQPRELTPSEKREADLKLQKLIELLDAAKRFDQETGQADCEDPEKIDWLKRVMATIEGMK